MTFRKLLMLSTLFLLSSCSRQATPSAAPVQSVAVKAGLVFVGTYTSGPNNQVRADGIFVYRMDPTTGALNQLSKAGGLPNPSYVTVDPSGRYLIAVSETGEYEGQPGGAVSSYAINAATGALALINSQPVHGASPAYISTDPSGKWVLTANYMGGNVTVLPLGEDGKLGAATAVVQHTGSGPNKDRQEAPHAHSVILGPGGKLVLAADLGIDKVLLYDLDPVKGTLTPHTTPALVLPPGTGPRHMDFHPNQRYLYVLGELASTVTAYQYDANGGTFQEVQSVSLLPADFREANTSADIHVAPSGKFLYASNRGNDSIAIFSINPSSGKLALVDHISTQGKTPRNFAIDPSGSFLLAANQDSGTIVSFRIDPETGKLTTTGQVTRLQMPVCIKFLDK